MEPNGAVRRVRIVDNTMSAALECFELGRAMDSGHGGREQAVVQHVATPPASSAADPVEVDVATSDHRFEAFYANERDRVYSALAITLGNADLAADAADEAMARAFQRWETVRTYASPGGWAFRVGLNWARSIVRRRHRSSPLLYQQDTVDAVVTDPDVHRALGLLDVKHRAVVVCRYVFGWSERETAEALELRPGTVKSRLSRATKQLQVQLGHLRQEETR
jgi:RNA polymerase sigma-70 factor (ECF subfamily)